MTTTGRRGRLFRRAEDEGEDDAADLSEDEHAWWADREEVIGVPHGAAPEPEPAAETDTNTGFQDYWSAESLFEEQARPKPPPAGSNEASPPTIEVPGAMDLDSAHLVLQVKVGVDWEDVTSAHRRLAKLYHPDRLISYSPEAQDLGQARMAEINAAHATLRALHFH